VSAPLTVRPLLRLTALLAIAASILVAFPGRPAGAQNRPEIRALDNAQTEFAAGAFQRASLSSDRDATINGDLAGAVQLAPVGTLRPWERVAVSLPERSDLGDDGAREGAAVVSIGNRLIVIGGSNGSGATNTILYASVDQTLGGITDHGVPASDPRFRDESWLFSTLPAVEQATGCSPESEITRAGAAALPTGPNTGFVYVVGGNFLCGDANLTSSAVQVFAVTADGVGPTAIPLQRLPSEEQDTGLRGVESPGVVVVPVNSTRAYLYVIGGLSTYNNEFFGPTSQAERGVFYIQINPATGAFVGDWQAADPVPLSQSVPFGEPGYGIYNHAAVVVSSAEVTAGAPVQRRGIVVAGGLVGDQNNRQLNTFVFRATINESNGALTWDSSPSVDDQQVPFVQEGASGISYNNKLYLIGGAPNESPASTPWVQTATYDDALLLRNFAGSASPEYFVGRGSNVLPDPRQGTGATVIDAIPPADNPTSDLGTAWAFVVGGSDASGDPSRFIYRGRIGGDEAEGNVRANEGWFTSRVFSVAYQNPGQAKRDARVLSIRWAADIDRATGNSAADMIVQFRRTLRADPNCTDESVFGSVPADAWITLPKPAGSTFYSQDNSAANPFNVITLNEVPSLGLINATCFQYRVRFLQNGLTGDTDGVGGLPGEAADRAATPRLLSMNIERVPVGAPDIRAKIFEAITFSGAPAGSPLANRVAGLSITLQNLNVEDPNATQDAGLENDGSFYVHLCVANESKGEQLNLPTLPVADPSTLPCAKAYYEVFKWQMTAGAELRLDNRASATPEGDPFTQTWKNPTDNAAIPDITALFREPGTYKVALLIDTTDFINEDTAGEANNRVENLNNGQPKILTVIGPPVTLLNLPLVRR
jgi:hypothetical protein